MMDRGALEYSAPGLRRVVAASERRRRSDSFHFHIARFHIPIDRVSVSQHETALLIS
jgi:hypothetical protein